MKEKTLKEYYDKYYSKNPDVIAVRQDGRALQYVKEQTPEICLEAVRQKEDAIQFVDENLIK